MRAHQRKNGRQGRRDMFVGRRPRVNKCLSHYTYAHYGRSEPAPLAALSSFGIIIGGIMLSATREGTERMSAAPSDPPSVV